MIVIVSDDGDVSTNNVIDWLHYEQTPYYRVNGLECFTAPVITSYKFGNNSAEGFFEKAGKAFSLEEVTGVWFRKDRYPGFSLEVGRGEQVDKQVNRHLRDENYYAKEGMYELLQKQANYIIGGQLINEPQKINTLLMAKSLGVDIPNTLVTNNKEDLLTFYQENNGAVTKPIKESSSIGDKQEQYNMYVMNLKEEELVAIPDQFMVSLFQERLDILFDIRVFYLDGNFYPIAIFTSKKNTDRVDVRDASKSSAEFRETKYQLSPELETQLRTLMNALQLVSGSIDLIHTKEGRTVFLEVNPWGQYGNVSRSGNYFLDKKIAHYLTHGSTYEKDKEASDISIKKEEAENPE